MLRLNQVELWAGDRLLLQEADWHVPPGRKVGLVGRNGSGKSTLLRAVAGERGVDGGALILRPGARVGYLPQTAVSGSTRALWDEVSSQMDRLQGLADALDAARRALEAGEEGELDRRIAALDQAETAFRLGGGYNRDERIGEVLHGLGFGPETWTRTCDTFSGGWQMRIALARLLLSEPDLLLLDEPTNHLDLQARAWLGNFLCRSDHAAIIVSHDRYLLDGACTHIGELRNRCLDTFTGGFSRWVSERELRQTQAQSAFDSQQEEIARLTRFVERFRATATKATQAQSRQKALDRMERVAAPERESKPRFQLPPAPACSPEVLTAMGLRAGYGDGPDVLQGVDLTLCRGMRLAILGPNGCGKSTLLAALTGRLEPRAGKVRLALEARPGVYAQDQAQELPAGLTALEHVRNEAPGVEETRARTALGALGLTGDAALRAIGDLSGGEKARVALATFVLRPLNLLFLDEPTNHLDAISVGVLADAVRQWDGAVLLISHDRAFIEETATHVGLLHQGKLVMHEGVQASDFDPKAEPSSSPAPGAAAAADTGAQAHSDRKLAQRERDRLRKRVAQLEAEIGRDEARLVAIDDALVTQASDAARVAALAIERAQVERRLEAGMEAWEVAAAEADASD